MTEDERSSAAAAAGGNKAEAGSGAAGFGERMARGASRSVHPQQVAAGVRDQGRRPPAAGVFDHLFGPSIVKFDRPVGVA